MTTFFIATRNAHKVGEIRALLADGFAFRTLNDLPGAPHVVEDAATFAGNATKKSVELAHWLSRNSPALDALSPTSGAHAVYTLADDSGLEVDILNGAPGVHSARFAGLDSGAAGNSSDAANNEKLLRLLAGVPSPRRTARFRCVLALTPVVRGECEPASPVCSADEAELQTQLFEGTCEGRIETAARGTHGFGYDPLFIPNDFTQSFAELGSDVKNQISHRAQALRHLQRWMIRSLAGSCPSFAGALFSVLLFLAQTASFAGAPGEPLSSDPRKPATDLERRFWLENMLVYHQFSPDEIGAATGLTKEEIAQDIARFELSPTRRPARLPGAPLLVLPYPGGRHPRIGFLDGAINPQRETKISVFTPWDEKSYVVVDVPEAIWSNLGLTYLAHTHVPTLWTKQGVHLPPLEWKRGGDGTLEMERTLPNGIQFGAKVRPTPAAVRMSLWLLNGTRETLSDLRVQNCVMLKGAPEFNQQTNANKVFSSPYVACRSENGQRWVISAWEPCHRPWANPPVPCLHSDPKFPDCPPGQSKRLTGWLSFYEGTDIQAEFRRIDSTGWRTESEAGLRQP